MNTASPNCPTCGTPLPPAAPAGLCPHCLLRTVALNSSPASGGDRPPPATPGQSFGDYRILRLLGRGGMGEVFEAEHQPTGRRVALKVMNHALASDTDRKRFLREGRLAAAVNHPNVVHILGSEEIGGVPIIAMELVQGGTLADRLKEAGPVSAAAAAAAGLQIIAGLEAAHAAGVLHRDIKPANCFETGNGTVKVGDFGLSVSTLARGQSLLTAKGTVLGTPAYASPEQLRGQELGVTSDIYSVGATLYHLVTGHPPFRQEDLVRLISDVLDRPPTAPASSTPEVPEDFSRLIMRCLAKEPKARFQSYASLREALLVHTEPARPAPLPLRWLAHLLDSMLAASLPFLVLLLGFGLDPTILWLRDRSPGSLALWLGTLAWGAAYYAIFEGRWGAGLGKRLCGLRVVTCQQRPPGWQRATWRYLVLTSPLTLPTILYALAVPAHGVRETLAAGGTLPVEWFELLGTPLLLASMRRRNGFAAIHDLLSQTRVVMKPWIEPTPALGALRADRVQLPPPGFGTALTDATPPPLTAARPYNLGPTLAKWGLESLILGTDPVLERQVWIHCRPASQPPVGPARQDLSRPARLRWLNQGESEPWRWDAYEAVEGIPLEAMAEPVPWWAVRFWLRDLARELSAATNDSAAPVRLRLDHVWIARTGQAYLLDFPCPPVLDHVAHNANPTHIEPESDTAAAAQHFLDHVARRALAGPDAVLPARGHGGTPGVPVPLEARGFLERLAAGAFERMDYVAGNLESLVRTPGRVSRRRRALSMFGIPAAILAIAVLCGLSMHLDEWRQARTWQAAFPGQPNLAVASDLYLRTLDQAQDSGLPNPHAELVRAYLVAEYSPIITNKAFWETPSLSGGITAGERLLLVQAVEGRTPPDKSLQRRAQQELGPVVKRLAEQERIGFLLIVGILTAIGMVAYALAELATLAWGRVGIGMRLCGLVLVDQQGRPAGRWRLVWRWALVWGGLSLLAASVAPLYSTLALPPDAHHTAAELGRPVGLLTTISLAALAGLGTLAGALGLARSLRVGWQDRLAGTRVVLR